MAVYKFSARAVARPGYDGFCRGGIKWPSNAEKEVVGTERLMKLIKAETMLSLQDYREYVPQEGEVVLDIPEPPYVDKAAQAVEEAKRLDAEHAAMQAQLELEAKRARNAKIAADLAALKASAPADPEPKPVEKRR